MKENVKKEGKSWLAAVQSEVQHPGEQVREGPGSVHKFREGVSCRGDRHCEGDPVREASVREVHNQSREDHHREGEQVRGAREREVLGKPLSNWKYSTPGEQVREGQGAVHEVRAGVSCREDRHREGDPVRGTSGCEVHTQCREDHHREGGVVREDPDVDGRRGPLLEHPH